MFLQRCYSNEQLMRCLRRAGEASKMPEAASGVGRASATTATQREQQQQQQQQQQESGSVIAHEIAGTIGFRRRCVPLSFNANTLVLQLSCGLQAKPQIAAPPGRVRRLRCRLGERLKPRTKSVCDRLLTSAPCAALQTGPRQGSHQQPLQGRRGTAPERSAHSIHGLARLDAAALGMQPRLPGRDRSDFAAHQGERNE